MADASPQALLSNFGGFSERLFSVGAAGRGAYWMGNRRSNTQMRLWHSNGAALALLILQHPTISFSTNTEAKNKYGNQNKPGLEKLLIASLTKVLASGLFG